MTLTWGAVLLLAVARAEPPREHVFPGALNAELCARALDESYRPRLTEDTKVFGEVVLWVSGQHPAYLRALARARDEADADLVRHLPLGFARPASNARGLGRWRSADADPWSLEFRRDIWRAYVESEDDDERSSATLWVLHDVVTALIELANPANHRVNGTGGTVGVNLSYVIASGEPARPPRAVTARFDDHFAAGDLARFAEMARVIQLPSIYPAVFAGLRAHRTELADMHLEEVGPAGPAPAGTDQACARLSDLTARFASLRRSQTANLGARAMTLLNQTLLELTTIGVAGVAWDRVARATLAGESWSAEDHAVLVDESTRVRAAVALLRAAEPALRDALAMAQTSGDAGLRPRVIAEAITTVDDLAQRHARSLGTLDRATFASSVVALRELLRCHIPFENRL